MQYSNVIPARFISRPNRFIARVELEGQVLNVHVKIPVAVPNCCARAAPSICSPVITLPVKRLMI